MKAVTALLVLTALLACGREKGRANTSFINESLVGTWRVLDDEVMATYEFRRDGSYFIEVQGLSTSGRHLRSTERGKWQQTESNVTFTTSESVTFTYQDNRVVRESRSRTVRTFVAKTKQLLDKSVILEYDDGTAVMIERVK